MLKMEEEQDEEDRVSMQLSTVELTVMSPNMLPEQVTLSVCVEIIPVVMACHVSQHVARTGDTVRVCVCVEIIPVFMACHVSQHVARTGDTVCV